MKINQKMLLKNWIYIAIVFIIGTLGIAIFVWYRGSEHIIKSTDRFGQFYLEERKADIKNEVNQRLDEIDYELKTILVDYEEKVKDRIHEISVAMHQSSLSSIKNENERMTVAVKLYEQITAADEEFLYFAISEEGVLLKSGTDDTLIGDDFYNVQDIEGKFYIQEMLETVGNESGHYVSYYWPKVKEGIPLKKTSYCLHLPEYNMIIGTGYYEEDVQNTLLASFVDRLKTYYEDEGDYIFINSYDSTVLLSGEESLIGTKMNTIINFDNSVLHEKMLEEALQDEGGFVTYRYQKKDSDIPSEKVYYVRAIQEWQAYIGLSFYMDDLNNVANDYTENSKKDQIREVYVIVTITVITALLVILLSRRGIDIQKKYFQQEESLYTKLFMMVDVGILIVSKKGDVLYINDQIQKLMGDSIYDYFENGQLNLQMVSENTYELITENDRTYYLEVKIGAITFSRRNAIIYYLKDVTESIVKSNELERIANRDELTKMSNRRALNNDFEDYCKDKRKMNVVLSIIDLDLFKNINDEYGHDVGDQVIIILAEVFMKRLRSSDKIYRYGGEEFVVILRDVSLLKAKEILENIKDAFSKAVLNTLDIHTSFSGGLVEIKSNQENCQLSDVIKKADERLYIAKRTTRNRLVINDEEA